MCLILHRLVLFLAAQLLLLCVSRILQNMCVFKGYTSKRTTENAVPTTFEWQSSPRKRRACANAAAVTVRRYVYLLPACKGKLRCKYSGIGNCVLM